MPRVALAADDHNLMLAAATVRLALPNNYWVGRKHLLRNRNRFRRTHEHVIARQFGLAGPVRSADAQLPQFRC
jgi:hypothetical protein